MSWEFGLVLEFRRNSVSPEMKSYLMRISFEDSKLVQESKELKLK